MTKLKRIFLFILVPVLLTTLGEFVLKLTINTLPISVATQAFSSSYKTHASQFILMATHPHVLIGIALILMGGCLWMVALSKFELSFLYPFLSINYALVIIGSQFLLKESVSIYRYLSVVLIMMGLVLISKSSYSEK